MTYPPNTPPPKPANSAARSWGSSGQRQPLDTARRRGHGRNGPRPQWPFVGLRHDRAGCLRGLSQSLARTCTYTGRVLRLKQPLNRKTADSQMRGGAVMSIGPGPARSHRNRPHHRTAAQPGLNEYVIPTHADAPKSTSPSSTDMTRHQPAGQQGHRRTRRRQRRARHRQRRLPRHRAPHPPPPDHARRLPVTNGADVGDHHRL